MQSVVGDDSFAPAPSGARLAELRGHCLVLVNRSILTLSALPDPEARFQRIPGASLPAPIYTKEEIKAQVDFAEVLRAARGEASPRAERFRPSPQDVTRYLDVLAWLNWLWTQAGGEREVRLIFARAHGVTWWKLSHRFNRGEETLRTWHKGAIAAITGRHWREIDRLSSLR